MLAKGKAQRSTNYPSTNYRFWSFQERDRRGSGLAEEQSWREESKSGKRDSIHFFLLEVIFQTATVLELRQASRQHPLWVVVYRIGRPKEHLREVLA